LYYSIVK